MRLRQHKTVLKSHRPSISLLVALLVCLAPLRCGAEERHAPDAIIEEAILQVFRPPVQQGHDQRELVQDAAAIESREAADNAQQQPLHSPGGAAHMPDERQQPRVAGKEALQAQQQQQQQRRRQQQAAGDEEAAVRRRQDAQDKLLKRKEALAAKRERSAHEAAHVDLLETQRKQAVEQGERLAARQEAEKQALSLGRGSLRAKKQQVVQRQPAVSGSRPGDVFAEQMEKRLTAAREGMAQRAEEQATLLAKLEAAQAAAQAAAKVRAASGGVAGSNGRQPALKQPQLGQQKQQQQQQAGAAADGSASGSGVPGTGGRSRIPLPLIVVMTFVMAAAAGLGALPFFFVRSMSEAATGLATAVACGVMLAASFDLVHDGQQYGAGLTVAGLLLGGAFIRWVQQQLAAYEDIQFGDLQGSSARKTVLMVGIMAAHALGEGCAVGVSFCGERGWAQGVLTTLAIGVHNIPEGLAKATVLVGQGVSPRRALGWSVLTCLPQPLVAIPSFVFVDAFMTILPIALGFAAGCMIWMVFAELLPDALERTPAAQVATAATVSAAGLEAFRVMFASMQQADGSIGVTGAAAAAAVGWRMMGPLLVLLPAVVVCAVAGGLLGDSAVPGPVAWGVVAAAALSWGGGTLVDQMLWRPQVPMLHTAAAAAAGGALALLLHRQLLSWAASAAAARKLVAKGGGGSNGGSAANGGLGSSDVEALEYSSLYQQHHLHHQVHAAHPLFGQNGHAQPPHPDGYIAAASGGGMNGFGGGSSTGSLPYHRGGSLPGAGDVDGGRYGGVPASPLNGLRQGGPGLPPPSQLAACMATFVACAAASVATGWHLACSLLLLGEDRSAAILPAVAMLLAGPGLGAGALTRTLPSRHKAALGAWMGGGLAALAALAAALAAARAHESAHTAALVRSFLYPFGFTDTAEAMAGGALCAAAAFCFGSGVAIKPPSARGGLMLGLAVAGLLTGLRHALCSFTPYCLSVQLLLKDR
ncbi:hypothetical protein D9Q98_005138 [Chlorella vulgaris]|uniref:Zinc transporter n=1 Tax=Chlorella vulgaris TaxID=3077 RepID=A0A9D4TNI4_CHLVU|nr:hypothetical protein D9Q98_005138 [Chlorella vulgaris]